MSLSRGQGRTGSNLEDTGADGGSPGPSSAGRVEIWDKAAGSTGLLGARSRMTGAGSGPAPALPTAGHPPGEGLRVRGGSCPASERTSSTA